MNAMGFPGLSGSVCPLYVQRFPSQMKAILAMSVCVYIKWETKSESV